MDLLQLKRTPQNFSIPTFPTNYDFASKSHLWVYSSEKNTCEKCFVKFPTLQVTTKRTFGTAFQANIYLPAPVPTKKIPPSVKAPNCSERVFAFSYPKQAQSVIPRFQESSAALIKPSKLNVVEPKKFYFATPQRIN